jgi:outer membrane protein assembly factor BamE (lipoprotein component of BamABCDE complex)
VFDFLKRFTRRRNVEFTNIEKKWMAEGPHIPEHQQKVEANIARHVRKAALNRQKQINAEQDEHITTQNMLKHHQRRLRTRYTNV